MSLRCHAHSAVAGELAKGAKVAKEQEFRNFTQRALRFAAVAKVFWVRTGQRPHCETNTIHRDRAMLR
jgi:hypothetical protein